MLPMHFIRGCIPCVHRLTQGRLGVPKGVSSRFSQRLKIFRRRRQSASSFFRIPFSPRETVTKLSAFRRSLRSIGLEAREPFPEAGQLRPDSRSQLKIGGRLFRRVQGGRRYCPETVGNPRSPRTSVNAREVPATARNWAERPPRVN